MASVQPSLRRLRQDAAKIFQSGIDAVNAEAAVSNACQIKGDQLHIQDTPFDLSAYTNIYVIGAGKASAGMAVALESLLGNRITGGAIAVKYAHTRPLKHIDLIEAGHPIPDDNGLKGAQRILELADQANEADLVICLLSGGGSALLPQPAASLAFSDKQAVIQALLDCGATINEINALRKHISAIKGGRLAGKVWPATLITLILSDVVGDKLDVIASGPTVPDSSTFADCLRIIESYHLKNRIPESVLKHLELGASGGIEETPKADAEVFRQTYNYIVGSNINALEAARKTAESLGYKTLILSSMIQGETREAARIHAAIAREIRQTGNPLAPPACLLSGGETTVTIKGDGLGGRNQEFALAAAIDIRDEAMMAILSGGTDGTDGPTDAAGAIVDGTSFQKAEKRGLSPDTYLNNNDSYHFFSQTGELLMTGPTGTNVMDLRIVLVGELGQIL
jgi:hydroxypyruvate reductase